MFRRYQSYNFSIVESHLSSDRRLTYVIVLLISKMSEKRKSTLDITTLFKKTTKVYQGKY